MGGRWVLTAAHCVRRKLYVRLGEHDLAVRDGMELEYKVRLTQQPNVGIYYDCFEVINTSIAHETNIVV